MSIAQQPRRVGGLEPRHTGGQRVTGQYDSQEVPVLIRLPTCSAQFEPPVPVAKPAADQRDASHHDSSRSKSERRKHNSKSNRGRGRSSQPEAAVNTKVIAGGILIGALIAGVLFFTNGGSSQPGDDDAWPDESGNMLAGSAEPDVMIPEVIESSPEFAYGAEAMDVQTAAAEAIDPMSIPNLADVPAPDAMSSSPPLNGSTPIAAATSFNEEPSTRLYPEDSNSTIKKANGWPTADLSDTAGPNYRSSMNGLDNTIYRTGRLDQTSPSGNILEGTIEVPTETSLR